MSKNIAYVVALLCLPLLRIVILHTVCDEWLRARGHVQMASFVDMIKANGQFQSFIGGWVFPVFIALVLFFWIFEEDKNRIPMQFLLLPLAYIPISIIGFTLVHAEFQTGYLVTNPILILTFGYAYVMTWVAFIAALSKLGIIRE